MSEQERPRDVVLEGHSVKRNIQLSELETKKFKLEVTQPVEFHIPGITFRDMTPRNVDFYCPDMYIINKLLKRFVTLLLATSQARRCPELSEHHLILYYNYGLVYGLLKTLSILDQSNFQLLQAVIALEGAGADRISLPTLLHPWISNLGKYVEDNKARTIIPRLPTIANEGFAYENYLWTENTIQHLPSFRALLFKIRLLYVKSNLGNAGLRNINSYRTSIAYNIADAPGNLIRRNDLWVPATSEINSDHKDGELSRLATEAYSANLANPILRYLQFNGNLIGHLQAILNPVISLTPTFLASVANGDGGSMQYVIAAEEIQNGMIIPNDPDPLPVNYVRIRPICSCIYNLGCHHQIVDGDGYNATVMPLVRRIPAELQLVVNNEQDDQLISRFLSEEKKFQSGSIASEDALAGFGPKRLD